MRNYNEATAEEIVRDFIPGAAVFDLGFEDELGERFFVSTADRWQAGKAYGSGRTPAEAWRDAYERNDDAIWRAIAGKARQ